MRACSSPGAIVSSGATTSIMSGGSASGLSAIDSVGTLDEVCRAIMEDTRVFEFGPFRLDAYRQVLLHGESIVPLTPKAVDLLIALVEQNGQVLTKHDLMRTVWPDTFVEEANLSHHIFAIRKALETGKAELNYIETIPRRGYRFIAPVTRLDSPADDLLVSEYTRTQIIVEELPQTRPIDESAETTEPRTINAVGTNARRTKNNGLFWTSGTLLLIAISLATYWWTMRTPANHAQVQELNSIAVLPFKPLVANSRDEALEMGMTETLVNNLSKLRRLVVKPTSAVRKYTDLQQDPVAAGRELGVDSVVDASIQKSEDRLRVVARLLSIKDGSTLWSDSFDERMTDIFTVQDRLGDRITAALVRQPTVTEKETLTKRDTQSVEAYQLYVRGRYFWQKFTETSVIKSAELFQQAIEKDANYARAYAGLADAYNLLGVNHLPPKDYLAKAKFAAEKAVSLDDGLADAHQALGAFELFCAWDWPAAERSLNRSIELNPNHVHAYELRAYVGRIMGRFDEALKDVQRARQIDPVSLVISGDLGETLRLSRRYSDAIQEFRKTLELDPNFPAVLHELSLAYALNGDYSQGVATINKAITLAGHEPKLIATLGQIHALGGKRVEALEVVTQLQVLARRRYVPAIDIAMVYSTLGDKDTAFAWLEKAFDEHACWLIDLKIEPAWDKLRPDPRFGEMLRRVGLPQ